MAKPLVIWRLTDGKPGHMQQTLGLANALARLTTCTIIDIDVSSRPVGWGDFLLRRFPPGAGLDKPDFILGAGHATHLALLAARRTVGGSAVALMKPSLPAFLFDVVIAPEHDALSAGPRVISTVGVLNPMQPGPKHPDSLLFLIGGPSKHVRWGDEQVLRQLESIVAGLQPDTHWRITDSRRTPATLGARLRERFGERFQPHGDCPPGWLAEQLATTGTVWVTMDSVSMVYESLTAGCRVGLMELAPATDGSRVMRGMAMLVETQHVTPFAEWARNHEMFPAARLNEADRAANLLLAKHGSPG